MLGTAPHRLYRRPHVAVGRQQLPSAGVKGTTLDLAALVQGLRTSRHAIAQHRRPDVIAVAADDGVALPVLARLLGIQRRVNATVHDVRATLAGTPADLVSAMAVGGMNADADDVVVGDGRLVKSFERFVDDSRRP